MRHRRTSAIVLILSLLLTLIPAVPASAVAPGTSQFQRTWQRTDQPVAARQLQRTWMWGPAAFTAPMYEEYAESPGTRRIVQYFDKSRMEITFPQNVDDGVWYVSNGLLVRELMTGELQTGHGAYLQREPARVNVAGDPHDPAGVTYALMGTLRGEPATPEGATIDRTLNPANPGNPVQVSDIAAARGVTAARFVSETNHTVAQPFWAFMTSSGLVYENGQTTHAALFQSPFYATGYPLTEAYWTRVQVGGTPHDVLVQCFERRCLTYTPGNPVEWQVEMGNVGQHYYRWRYGTDIPSEPPAMDVASYRDVGALFLAEWPANLGGQSGLILANQSPYPMVVTLDGPQSRSITVPACPDCVVYQSPAQFTGCRDTLPEQLIFVTPGTYRAKVEFVGGNLSPARSYWTVVPDGGYNNCFYSVVQQ